MNFDRSTLTSLYPGGGAPAHDPQMMLKVILLAYASGVYSSRAIARATRENVGFLWICGMRPLDHMTINRFRTERVRHVFEEVFSEVIQLLADMGLVTLDTYFLDGTKVEANANRFTFVWAKSTKRYKEQLRARVHAHLAAIDEMDDEEEALAPEGPAEVDSEAIAEAARRINERIGGKRVGKRPRDDEGRALRKAKRMLEGEWRERTERGSTLGKQRSVDVETIFGDIKRNWGFRRFLLRGLEKVDHEMRMVAMGHNIRKMAYALAV